MRAVDSTFALRTLIAALPEDRLGALLLELLLGQLQATTADPPAPARRRRGGWPRGNPRGPRKAAKRTRRAAAAATARRRRAEKRATQQAAEQAAAEPEPNGNAGLETISAAMFWGHAKALNRERPWVAVMREFDIKEPIARNCYGIQSLPPHVGPMAVSRFSPCP